MEALSQLGYELIDTTHLDILAVDQELKAEEPVN